MNQTNGNTSEGKQKMIAGLLGILLGSIGIHHFYLGSKTSGIILIALTVCSCGTLSFIGLIEGIMLLIMSDEDFEARYNQREPEAMEFVFMKPATT